MKPAKRSVDRGPHRSLVAGMLAALGFFTTTNASATDYYVATTGNDANAGTLDQPFATLQKGANIAAAGDTVYVRGGTYYITTPNTSGAGVTFNKSGTSD